MTQRAQIPGPGTQEAVDQGCKCPVLDTEHGRGYRGVRVFFVYSAECPIHLHPEPELDEQEPR